MSTSTTSQHLQPRRRAAAAANGPGLNVDLTQPSCPAAPSLPSAKDLSLRKGATFHSPTSPSSPIGDPILDVRSLPSRSLTSPKALEDLVAASEKRVADLLETFDRSFSGLGAPVDTDLAHKDVLPVPSFILAHAASHSDLMDGPSSKEKSAQRHSAHHHGSDSGLGSSVSTSDAASPRQRMSSQNTIHNTYQHPVANPASPHDKGASSSSTSSVYSALTKTERAHVASHSASTTTKKTKPTKHFLGPYATRQIQVHVVEPLLDEPTLKPYHSLVKGLPDRIGDRSITCLRDLEKTLIFLAPVSVDISGGESVLAHCFLRAKTKATSAASYLKFCETSIQCIHTTVAHLNEIDQRRPSDRPYTNNYFVDLVEQVRAYARIMAVSRQKKAKGQKLDDSDVVPSVPLVIEESLTGAVLTLSSGEKLQLRGGVSQNGEPVELVREREDGKTVRIDAGQHEMLEEDDDDDELMDDDVRRSMARKRKCDIGKVEYRACRECGKVYTRPCDLTKHEKTHSRPWKCTDPTCKYAEEGWPTEKERDRHMNDKHMEAPALYKCLFKPCAYTSKRESNCKQHMEKAHGWEYVRSKSKKGEKLVATQQSPPTSLVPTPASGTAFPRLSTPLTSIDGSPANFDTLSPDSTHHSGSMMGSSRQSMDIASSYGPSPADGTHTGAADAFVDFGGFDTGFNAGGNHFLSPEMSQGRRGSFGTSGTGFTPSPVDSSVPTMSFEDTFNFSELNYNWPSMGEYFPQYSIPVGAQQPTPAWSDLECDFHQNATGPHPELSPSGQVDAMFGAPGGLVGSDDGFVDFAQTKTSANDFTLFGPHGESSADGAAAGAMFPALGNVGGVFDDVDMEEYIYGDSRRTTPL